MAARKSADDTLNTIRILLERGCKELINEPDSLGNTPLHALLVRYALEEARYGFQKWNKWDILHLVRFLLQNGAKSSINQAGNSALACVFRHVRDWEVCYELLNMLIKEEGIFHDLKSNPRYAIYHLKSFEILQAIRILWDVMALYRLWFV